MAGNGLNLGVGIDLSAFQKDIQIINKELKTAAGQDFIIKMKVSMPKGELQNQFEKARKEFKKIRDEVNNVSFADKNGVAHNVIDLPSARKAIAFLKKEYKTAMKAGDISMATKFAKDISLVNDYIISLGRLSDAMAKAGIGSVPKEKAIKTSERSRLNEEIKLIEKKKQLNATDTTQSNTVKLDNEIKLQKQLIALLEKKNATYASGSNKANNARINEAKSLLNTLKAQKDYASALQRIKNLEDQRASTSGITNKLQRLQKERIAVSGLIKAWENYQRIANKRGDTSGVSMANSKIRALRQQEVALNNLTIAERNRVKATNQQNSLFNEQANIFARLKTLAATYFSIYSVINFIKQIVGTTKEFERQKVALEGIVGSAADATKAFEGLKTMALESPFNIKELIGYTKQLSAYGIVVEELLPTTNKLADLSAGLGVDMSRLILAYGQVNAAAVLRGQELRQFTEAGVPLVDKLAKKFSDLNGRLITTGEVFEMISKRQVSFEMVSEVLTDMTSEGGEFYKMQENLTNTLYGQIEKLKEMWTLALKELGDDTNGFINSVIKSLQRLTKHLPLIARAISIMFGVKLVKDFISSVGNATDAFKKLHRQIQLSQTAGAKLVFTFRALGSAFSSGIILAALSAVVAALFSIGKKTREWNEQLEELNHSFGKDTAKYVVGFERLLGKLSAAKEGTKEYNNALDTLKSNYGEFVNDSLIKQLVEERRQLKNTADGWGMLHDSIVAAIQAKKEYERHNARKELAAESLYKEFKIKRILRGKTQSDVNDITNKIVTNPNLSQDELDDYTHQQDILMKIGADIKTDELQAAFQDAIADFTAAGESSIEEFKKRLINTMKAQGIGNDTANYVVSKIKEIFDKIKDSSKFATYLKEIGILKNNPYELINKEFDNARNNVFNSKEGRWVEGMENTKYNPFQKNIINELELSKAAKTLTSNFLGRITSVDINDSKEFEKAKAKVNSAFADLSFKSFQDNASKTKEIADALKSLFFTIKDAKLRNQLNEIIDQFTTLAGTKTGRAMQISTRLQQDYANADVSHEMKDYMLRFIPTDENLEDNIKAISGEFERVDGIIKRYGDTQEGENKLYVERLKLEREWLKILMSDRFYDIEKNDGNGNLPTYISELFDGIKTAYTRYKEVTQKGGIGFGLDYVKNNEYFQKNFGAFFNGAEGKQFESIAGLKIGDKTAGDIIKESFITSGAENGILDFKSALSELQKELESYGNADKKHRKAYLNAAKELEKWINETFSKDNLSATLQQLDRELKQLPNTFDKTNKAVDLYRQLQKNGTAGTLGANLGVTRETSLLPKSAIQRSQASEYIQLYNKTLPAQAMKFELGDISTIDGVYDALEKLEKITMLNNNAFGVEGIGSQVGKNAQELLKKLLETLIEEAKSISGEVYTGDAMKDLVANATKRTATRMDDLVAQQNVARGLKTYDYGAIKDIVKANQEEAKGIFDQFMKDSRLDIIAQSNDGKIDTEQLNNLETKLTNISNGFPELLKKELLSKLKDLRDAVMDYNAKIAAPGSVSQSLKNYRNAGDDAKKMFEEESKNYKNIQLQIPLAESGVINANVDELNAQLAASKERLDAMGGSVVVLEEKLKQLAIENLQKSLQGTQDDFNAINDAANSVISCFKAMSSTIKKVYGALNAGETPEWMEDMDSFLNEFGDMFNSLVAPIMAVITAVISLTAACVELEISAWPLLAIMGALMLLAGAFAVVKMAIEKHDNELQEGIDELEKQITATENAMKNLNATANRMSGIDKLNKQFEANAKNLELYRDSLKQAELEANKKDSDDEKVADYKQKAQEYHDAFLDGIKSTFDEITGTVESYADAISSAMRNAFQNGTNAAIAMKDAVKTSLGDMVENLMKTIFLMPQLEKAMERFLGGNEEDYEKMFTKSDGSYDYEGAMDYFISRTNNEENVKDFQKSLYTISEGYIDMYESMPDMFKDVLTHLSGTSSTSGGISSITEDTARSLEGIGNSQLMQLIQIRQLLEIYGSSNLDKNHMSYVQTHLTTINNNVASIVKAITELRTSSTLPIHVKMV